jgi:hypothetical protein
VYFVPSPEQSARLDIEYATAEPETHRFAGCAILSAREACNRFQEKRKKPEGFVTFARGQYVDRVDRDLNP